MTHDGKCPQCNQLLDHVKVARIPIGQTEHQIEFHGLSFLCPFCLATLGVSVDPEALKIEAVSQIQTYVRLS